MSDLIDRQAVIDLLKQMRKDEDMVPWEGKDVFARIRKLPTIQPEKAQHSHEGTTSDLIDRQAALDIFDDYNVSVENGELEAYSRDRKRMCELPTVPPDPQWISVTERLPDNADHPGAFCPRYQVVTPYGVTEGWYRPHDHEKGGQWFALFWFMSQIYEIWNIDFEKGDVPKVIGEAPVMEWRPLPEPYKPNK